MYMRLQERLWQLNHEAGEQLSVREFRGVLELVRSNERISRNDLNYPFVIISVDHQGDFATFDPELLGADAHCGRFAFGRLKQESLEDGTRNKRFLAAWCDVQRGVKHYW